MPGRAPCTPRCVRRRMLVRRWLRVIVASITYYTCLSLLRGSRPRACILMYHSISDNPSDLHSVSPTAFEKQMRFLAKKCNVISLDRLVHCFNVKGMLPDNAVVITFDDGLADTYTAAYPVLKKYDLPATVFVAPNWVSPCGISQRHEARLGERHYMTWNQIQEMSQNGISIGAHTMSHCSLPTLTPEEAHSEILESKTRLEQQLGQPVKFFAYPYGAFRDLSPDIVRMVAESGYTCAVTSLSGVNGPGLNIYALRRIEIEVGDGMYVFRRGVAGALSSWIVLQWFRWMSQILSGIRRRA